MGTNKSIQYKKALEQTPFVPFLIRDWLTHARSLLICLAHFKMHDEYNDELVDILDKIKHTPKEVRTSSFEDELNTTLLNINMHRDLSEGNFNKILTYIKEVESLVKS